MKFLCVFTIILLSVTSLFSQEFIKNSIVHFKDSSTKKGDFYYYPALDQSVTVVDSLENKQVYDLKFIESIEGKADLYIVAELNGLPKLFESIIEGEKASLYKTNYNNNKQFYILKDGQMTWLEGGDLDYEKDGKNYRRENTRYKGTLKYLLNDNKYVVDKIDKITYFESDLTPLIIAYNNGRIKYVKTKAIEKQNKVPNTKIYAQYSNGYNTPQLLSGENFNSMLFNAGLEFFSSESSKHSFKFGFEYGKFDFDNNPDGQWINFNSSYYYDFSRMPGGNVYIGVRLVDIGYAEGEESGGYYLLPRLSPLIGYEHHISNRTDLYIEVNHLFQFSSIPRNFSFGFSYDL